MRRSQKPSAGPRPPGARTSNDVYRGGELLEYAMTWRHWGGGHAEEIFVQFGISSAEYFTRLELILREGHYRCPPRVRLELLELCRRKLEIPG